MAKVTITIEDRPGENLGVTVVGDPPLAGIVAATPAQLAALQLLEGIAGSFGKFESITVDGSQA